LADELRAVAFQADFRLALENLELFGDVHAIVPGIFLLQVLHETDPALAGHNGKVLHEYIGRTVALACRSPQDGGLREMVFQVKSGGEESTIFVVVVGADARDDRQVMVGIEGILEKGARDLLGAVEEVPLILVAHQGIQRVLDVVDIGPSGFIEVSKIPPEIILTVIVELEAQSRGEPVVVADDPRLVQSLGIQAVFPAFVSVQAKGARLVVDEARQDEGDAFVGLTGKHKAIFEEGFEAPRLDVHAVGLGQGSDAGGILGKDLAVEVHASPMAILLHILDAEPGADLFRHLVIPAVEEVDGLEAGQVHEGVAVAVELVLEEGIMPHHQGAQLVVELVRADDVALEPFVAVAEQVEEKPLGGGRFLVFDIDLPRGAFEAVDHRGGSFRYLDGFHPGTGDVVESERRAQPPDKGNVLGDDLAVDARQAQQLYLPGAGDGIGIDHIDRGVGLEALRQIAAGGPVEFALGDDLHMPGIKFGDEGAAVVFHHHLAEDAGILAEDDIDLLLPAHGHGVCLKSHETEDEPPVGDAAVRNLVVAVFVGGGPDGGA